MTTTRIDQLTHIAERLGTESAARALSALGHPGYDEGSASKVLYEWVRLETVGTNLHSIIYTGIKFGVIEA